MAVLSGRRLSIAEPFSLRVGVRKDYSAKPTAAAQPARRAKGFFTSAGYSAKAREKGHALTEPIAFLFPFLGLCGIDRKTPCSGVWGDLRFASGFSFNGPA